ncbi:MAG TPA: tetratricopeptide repeat protein, partial [Rhizomicrobium sp.]
MERNLALCDDAIRSNPKAAIAYCNRGFVLHALERFAEALESCDRSIELKPDFAEAHYNRGNSLKKLGR